MAKTKNVKLDRDERELLKSVESGEWQSVPDLRDRIKRLQQYAKNTLQKDQRVNIRLSSSDLHGLQRRALREGIPYQTLMASILHKYVTGSLNEKHA